MLDELDELRQAGGYYLDEDALAEALHDIWPSALRWAALEAFEGIYAAEHLAAMVQRDDLWEGALPQLKQK